MSYVKNFPTDFLWGAASSANQFEVQLRNVNKK